MQNRMECPTVDFVNNFIDEDTSIEEFYNCITNNGTNFDYDINHSFNSYTPLYVACKEGNISLVKALIKMGAHLNPENFSSHKTPLEVALKTNNINLIKLLKDNGAKTSAECGFKKKYSLLDPIEEETYVRTRYAAEKGDFGMVKLHVASGRQIIEPIRGITIAMAAKKAGHPEIAEYLEEVQKNRFLKLKSEVIYETYGKTFLLGFFDKNSNLSLGLDGMSRDIAGEVITSRLRYLSS